MNDDMVKEVLPSRERIIEVLESVGFDADRQKLPVASLSGEGRWMQRRSAPVRRGHAAAQTRRWCAWCVCHAAAAHTLPACSQCVPLPRLPPPPRWLEDEAGAGARHADECRHHAAG